MPHSSTFRGEWAVGADYAVGDVVRAGTSIYIVARDCDVHSLNQVSPQKVTTPRNEVVMPFEEV